MNLLTNFNSRTLASLDPLCFLEQLTLSQSDNLVLKQLSKSLRCIFYKIPKKKTILFWLELQKSVSKGHTQFNLFVFISSFINDLLEQTLKPYMVVWLTRYLCTRNSLASLQFQFFLIYFYNRYLSVIWFIMQVLSQLC